MSTSIFVPVNEYLTTSYSPDCEYLDGELLERNVGEKDHSKVQARLIVYLSRLAEVEEIHVFPEQRVQVTSSRFRVPDVLVVAGPEPPDQIFTEPPFLCIEILSKDDRMTEMQERIDDYLRFGVRYVWVLDPRLKRAFSYTSTGFSEIAQTLETVDPVLMVPLAAIFS